ncbi:MAG: polysaccharide biosynthesis/export family protein [Synechococcales bacterium]|nr:polysaccharide biosynthesis/export family protein [Synechococcales bacterium]
MAKKMSNLLAVLSAPVFLCSLPLGHGFAYASSVNPAPPYQPTNADPATDSPATAPGPIDLTPNSGNDYVLGVGDLIQVDIFEVPEFSGEENGRHLVFADGSISVPWVGKVSVVGMTLSGVEQLLTQRFAAFVNEPLITVSLVSPRPIRVGVVGEVNRPGSYIVEASSIGAAVQGQSITDTIRAAGGITQLADIRRIQIRRSSLTSGQEQVFEVDFWNFLQFGSFDQDITLRDGDVLVVPTATDLTAEEVSQLAIANISPDTINVNVVGEVVSPGAVTVQPNASLNQALLAAGGFRKDRARQSRVELIRLNPNGTVSRRDISVDLSASINEETNPALRNNDIVVVNRSGLASASDFLTTLTRPLSNFFGILGLFGFP